jgi:hypothetical protein
MGLTGTEAMPVLILLILPLFIASLIISAACERPARKVIVAHIEDAIALRRRSMAVRNRLANEQRAARYHRERQLQRQMLERMRSLRLSTARMSFCLERIAI